MRNSGHGVSALRARFLLVLLVGGHVANCQLSQPRSHDSHWKLDDNKFLKREATADAEERVFDDVLGDDSCPLDVELKWMTEVSSSVYATPLITDLYSDGRKDIIVPSFVHYLDALEGPDGAKALGWPAFHKSSVHSSPLLYDLDLDGVRDILIATYDGEIMGFKDTGEKLMDVLQIPRLRVRKDWYVGLHDDPVDHSHPDVGGNVGANNPFEKAVHGGGGSSGTSSGGKSSPHAAIRVTNASPPAATEPAAGGKAPSGVQQPLQQQYQQQGQQQPQQQQGQGGSPSGQPQAQQQQQQPQPHAGQQQQTQRQQPAQQQHQQLQGGSSPSPAALTLEVKEAAGKFRQKLKDYAAQFGQAAADNMLEVAKTQNPQVYVAVKDQIKAEQELQQLLGTGATHWRRLMELSDNQQPMSRSSRGSSSDGGGSSSRRSSGGSNDGSGGSVLGAGSVMQRRRLNQAQPQQQQPQQGGTGVGQTNPAGGAGGAAGGGGGGVGASPAGAPGVELDPTGKGLSQEALDSFKLFQDDVADLPAAEGTAGGTGPDLSTDVPGSPGPSSTGDGTGGGGTAGTAGGSGSGDGQQQQQEEEGQQLGDLAKGAAARFDEFGDRLPDMDFAEQKLEAAEAGEAAGGGDGGGLGAAGVAEEYKHLMDEEYLFSEGKFANAADWEDEMFTQLGKRSDGESVWVDAHVLCTPAIADLDGDGHDELVVSVSYFFDKEYYDEPSHARELGNVRKDKYVAGGIVVFDLRSKLIKWSQHLDLTTDTTRFKAHIFSPPTLVDVNHDGKLEIIVGTSVGFVYILDHKGSTLEGWPIQMGEVQGQVFVADLNSDGEVEIFAGDSLGNIAMFNVRGRELWERHVKSMVAQGAVAGDIDGDGLLEIVFGTVDGKVYAVRAHDGKDKPHFPYQTTGRVQAQPTITHLNAQGQGQHILVMSFDGLLYLIDGMTGCAHTVDIGESSYAAVLVDDLDGDGFLQLLVATMNGNVYCLDTRVPYHPLKTWTSQVQGLNGQIARYNYYGVYALPQSRMARDVAGQNLQVKISIVDKRKLLHLGSLEELPDAGPYNVTVVLKGVGVAEMNAGPQPVIGVADTFAKPGEYVVELPCPRTRTTAAVHIDVADEHGLHYQDEFVLSFHMHYHKLLKWLIALPLLAMALVVWGITQSRDFEDANKSFYLG